LIEELEYREFQIATWQLHQAGFSLRLSSGLTSALYFTI